MQIECGIHPIIFYGILSVPRNIVMDLNVMMCITMHIFGHIFNSFVIFLCLEWCLPSMSISYGHSITRLEILYLLWSTCSIAMVYKLASGSRVSLGV